MNEKNNDNAQHQNTGEGRIFTEDEALIGTGRRPIDKDWSGAKKALVSGASIVAACGALAWGGYTWWLSTPPSAPTSAAEAVAVMQSARYANMDADRRRTYATQAGALLRALPEDERRELMSDEDARRALGEAWREAMDEQMRRWARGEEMERPFGRPGGRPGGRTGERQGGEELSEEERAERRAAMASRMRSMMNAQFSSGDAQAGGLRGEMFAERRQQREAGGGGGERGGGGRGG